MTPDVSTQESHAPWLNVPPQGIISLEHPAIINNIDKAVESLGGIVKLETFLTIEDPERALLLRLRPEDAFRRSLYSRPSQTDNILMKVTIPKPTGRKRKRGSSEPFAHHEDGVHQSKSSDYLLRCLADNVATAKFEAVGVINESHRFRDLPDFQYSLQNNVMYDNLTGSILNSEYHNIKSFKLDSETKGVQPQMDMIPPPIFSQTTTQFNYAYRQNPSVKNIHDPTGKQTTLNISKTPKSATQLCSYDITTIPTGPERGIVPEESLEPRLRQLLSRIRQLFERRPICTRRMLINHFQKGAEYDLKIIMQYVGYMFRSGPWKDTYIRFGVDPRKDPGCRIYQSLTFQIAVKDDSHQWADGRVKYRRRTNEQPSTQSHLFDGETLTADGKIWQFCDITDPLLKSIVDGDTPRAVCDIKRDGWSSNGAFAKLRTIMRDKIAALISKCKPSDTNYLNLIKLPNNCKDNAIEFVRFAQSGASAKEQLLAAQIRSLVQAGFYQEKQRAIVGKSGVTDKKLRDGQNVQKRGGGDEVHEKGLGGVEGKVSHEIMEVDGGDDADAAEALSDVSPESGDEDEEEDNDDNDDDDEDEEEEEEEEDEDEDDDEDRVEGEGSNEEEDEGIDEIEDIDNDGDGDGDEELEEFEDKHANDVEKDDRDEDDDNR